MCHSCTLSHRHLRINQNGLNLAFFCLSQIAASLEKNLLPRLSNSPPDIESLRLYLTLPECPLFSDRNNYVTIAIPFAKAVINLKEAPLKVLGRMKKALLCVPTRVVE